MHASSVLIKRMNRIIALAITLTVSTPLMARVNPGTYCDGYREVLLKAVADHRMGAPNYAKSVPIEQWQDDLNFIFSKPVGFGYRDWIQDRYLKCWQETPYGPDHKNHLEGK